MQSSRQVACAEQQTGSLSRAAEVACAEPQTCILGQTNKRADNLCRQTDGLARLEQQTGNVTRAEQQTGSFCKASWATTC